MYFEILIIASIVSASSISLTYIIVRNRFNSKIKEYKTIEVAILGGKKEYREISDKIAREKSGFFATQQQLKMASGKLQNIIDKTEDLQNLRKNSSIISQTLKKKLNDLKIINSRLNSINDDILKKKIILHNIMGKVDLYSRLDEFVECGHFEIPEYLHGTSLRFAEEIKRVREKQKTLISRKNAVTYPGKIIVSADKVNNKRVLDGQVKLMLITFNIECDNLIGKVNPSNFPRILERIEKISNNIEKTASNLHCGFNIDYINLKYTECQLQYQFKLKKQEEQEEQQRIREQIREEQKAVKEVERALAKAEREEKMYREMLEKARSELSKVTDENRIIAEQRISDLEHQLAEAKAREERAKSMAQQTRKGHVYVISNIGSFGDNVYKIGLTRRLEPMDRVKELGDASVPFSFDVHAMIYTEDAPTLEKSLHREFSDHRVNAVNFRKEFFRTNLKAIKSAVKRLTGLEAEFKMTILAEEYYESRRLQAKDNNNLILG